MLVLGGALLAWGHPLALGLIGAGFLAMLAALSPHGASPIFLGLTAFAAAAIPAALGADSAGTAGLLAVPVGLLSTGAIRVGKIYLN